MKKSKDTLGDRMKSYENSYRFSFPKKLPIIIRADGKSFSKLLSKCKKPFDSNVLDVMNQTAIYMCQSIQGAKVAYVQSDEISILLTDYQTHETDSWFSSNLNKIVSVSAALAVSKFTSLSPSIFGEMKLAQFDSRAFILSKDEVNNYFIWRQQDATRNSVQMTAQSLYSHKELHKKNNSALQEMIFQKGINWGNLPISEKRGRCIVKNIKLSTMIHPKTKEEIIVERSVWEVDNEIPEFSKKHAYIDQYL